MELVLLHFLILIVLNSIIMAIVKFVPLCITKWLESAPESALYAKHIVKSMVVASPAILATISLEEPAGPVMIQILTPIAIYVALQAHVFNALPAIMSHLMVIAKLLIPYAEPLT